MMSERQLALAAGVFRVLSQTVNLELCQWLFQSRPMSQTDLAKEFNVSQPTMGMRLAKLRGAGLAGFQQNGRRQNYFLIKSEAVRSARQFLGELRQVASRKKEDRPTDPNLERLLTTTFTALSQVNRLRLCALLAEMGELAEGDLADRTRMSQPLTSVHLSTLTAAGLTQLRRDPTNLRSHFYSLANSVRLVRALDFLGRISRHGREPIAGQNPTGPAPRSLGEVGPPQKKRRGRPLGSREKFSLSNLQPIPTNLPRDHQTLYFCYTCFCRDANANGQKMVVMAEEQFFSNWAGKDYWEQQSLRNWYIRGYPASKLEMIKAGYLKPDPRA